MRRIVAVAVTFLAWLITSQAAIHGGDDQVPNEKRIKSAPSAPQSTSRAQAPKPKPESITFFVIIPTKEEREKAPKPLQMRQKQGKDALLKVKESAQQAKGLFHGVDIRVFEILDPPPTPKAGQTEEQVLADAPDEWKDFVACCRGGAPEARRRAALIREDWVTFIVADGPDWMTGPNELAVNQNGYAQICHIFEQRRILADLQRRVTAEEQERRNSTSKKDR